MSACVCVRARDRACVRVCVNERMRGYVTKKSETDKAEG
jgi:hypothetical protein